MAKLVEDTNGKIRCLPIAPKLRAVLLAAAEVADVDTVQVTSGGQVPLGKPGKRTGSTRHDNGNAADLQLIKNSRTLNFTNPNDVDTFVAFVTSAVAQGASGVGAGVGYMGRYTIHVGYGTPAVWGGIGNNPPKPPQWLVKAFEAGRKKPARSSVSVPFASAGASGTSASAAGGRFTVIARNGLRLRRGPGVEFDIKSELPAGFELTVMGWDGPRDGWALVDLENDGLADGHVAAAFLRKPTELASDDASDPAPSEDVAPLLLADSETDEPDTAVAA